jgi:hypothetical protein
MEERFYRPQGTKTFSPLLLTTWLLKTFFITSFPQPYARHGLDSIPHPCHALHIPLVSKCLIYRMFHLNCKPNYNSICKLWRHQYGKTNE